MKKTTRSIGGVPRATINTKQINITFDGGSFLSTITPKDDKINEEVEKTYELSSSIIQRFSGGTGDNFLKTRVLEEIHRVEQRKYISQEEQKNLIQKAIHLDAPKIARKITTDAKYAEEDSKYGGSFLTGRFFSESTEVSNKLACSHENMKDYSDDERFCKVRILSNYYLPILY